MSSATAHVMRFVKCSKEKDLKELYLYNVDVFAEATDFVWSLENLKREREGGWDIYALFISGEIVAAAFLRFADNVMYTKNTSLKMNYQGKGFSHRIKDFFEHMAKSHQVKEIVHYCAVDNFRAIALNESHGYIRGRSLKNGEVVEWRKKMVLSPRAIGE